MTWFKSPSIRIFFSMATCLVVFNMSFFFAEVSCIQLDMQNRQMLENMVRIISGLAEEEKDSDFCSEGPHLKEVDLFVHYSVSGRHHSAYLSSVSHLHELILTPLSGALKNLFRPPEG